MIKITRTFFCDSFELGQFGKLNIFGFIPRSSIAINEVPYNLVSNFVIVGEMEQDDELRLSLSANLKDQNNQSISNIQHDLSKFVSAEKRGTPPFLLFLKIPVQIEIVSYGRMIISVAEQDKQIFQESYDIVLGESPSLAIREHIPQSKVFSGSDSVDLVFAQDLLSTASKTLVIFDSYAKPDVLVTLLAHVNPSINITIVTSARQKSAFQNTTVLYNSFPHLGMKFTDKNSGGSHDRFVIINDSEYYHFGHSIADIVSGKLSRCSKVVNRKELDKFVS